MVCVLYIITSSNIAVYLGLRLTLYFSGRSIMEFLLMAFISLAIGFVSPSFGWFSKLVFFECYVFFFFFFLKDMYYSPASYFPLAGGVAGNMNWIVSLFMC